MTNWKKDWYKILCGLFIVFLISGIFLPAIIEINFRLGFLIWLIFTIGDLIIYYKYGKEIILWIIE